MPAVLKSRIPQIILSLPHEVEGAMQPGLQRIASDAASRAPVGPTGDLRESIEAGEDGVYAIWRWFFTEFGTVKSAAQPFMLPALEAQLASLLEDVENALEDL